MCEINFAHILSLWETGGRGWGGCSDFEVVSKMKKVYKCFQILFMKIHLRIFRKIETRAGFWGGGCRNFKVVSQRQNLSKFYYAHIPKGPSRNDVIQKSPFLPPPCHLYVTFADPLAPPPTSRHLLDPKKIRIFFDFKFIPKKWVFFLYNKKMSSKKISPACVRHFSP